VAGEPVLACFASTGRDPGQFGPDADVPHAGRRGGGVVDAALVVAGGEPVLGDDERGAAPQLPRVAQRVAGRGRVVLPAEEVRLTPSGTFTGPSGPITVRE
jgi:hypothetical protein